VGAQKRKKRPAKTPAEAEIVRFKVDAVERRADLTLDELAKAANDEHRKAIEKAESAAAHAYRCGLLLITARERCEKEGQSFRAWLGERCEVSRGHAYRFISIAEKSEVEEISVSRVRPNIAGLTLRAALDAIGKPAEQAEKKAEAAEERRAAAAPVRKASGEVTFIDQSTKEERKVVLPPPPPPSKPDDFDPEPEEQLNPFEVCAERIRQALKQLEANRLSGYPPVVVRMRDEACAEIRENAVGQLTQLGRDARESLLGAKAGA
jgi:hypothetical protein